jgi:amidase
VLDGALAPLRDSGAELVELGEYPALRKIGKAEIEVLLFELKDSLDAYLATLGGQARVKSLADVIRFNEANAATELGLFGQDLFERAQAKGSLTDAAYREARATSVRLARIEGLDRMLDAHALDAVISITSGPAWLTDVVHGDARVGGSSTLAAVAGYPSVTVPAGHDFGLPVGLSFTGRPWSEARLLALAAAFESRTGARRPPRFLPTLPVLR